MVGGDDLKAHTIQVFRHLEAALAAVSATPDDVVNTSFMSST